MSTATKNVSVTTKNVSRHCQMCPGGVRGITLVENDCSSFALLFHVTYIFLNIAFFTHLFIYLNFYLVFIRQAPGLYVPFISCILFFCLKRPLFVPFLTFTWFFSFSLHWTLRSSTPSFPCTNIPQSPSCTISCTFA